MIGSATLAVVVIGRNEGERLVQCLASVKDCIDIIVYVDSGSTDKSVETARAVGAKVVELDPDIGFTAARARNAGIDFLRGSSAPEFIQFIDGDCELQLGWISTALAFLEAHPKVGVVCGRRRERFPEASVYNRLCDREWDTPIGHARSSGGDALMRMAALDQVGGFNPTLIAGEEPELCLRLRGCNWQIWRLDSEMTLHDAAMPRFSQWWNRARRGGYAAAEGMALHGAPPERHGVATVRRAIFWGLVLPLMVVIMAAVFTPWAFVLLLAYPAQLVRNALRGNSSSGDWELAMFRTIGKFPEVLGVLEYWVRRIRKKPNRIIEYK